MSDSVTVYYVRHAENVANVTGQFSYRAIDLDLTERGMLQAKQVAEFLAAESIGDGPVYTSALRRSVQTAEIIGQRLGRAVEVIEEFRELDVGELEGRADSQAVEMYWEMLEAWADNDRARRFPGGESHVELVRRLKKGFGRITALAMKGPHVLVAHAGLLRAGFSTLASTSPATRLKIPNCSVSRLEITPHTDAYAFSYWARGEFLTELTPLEWKWTS